METEVRAERGEPLVVVFVAAMAGVSADRYGLGDGGGWSAWFEAGACVGGLASWWWGRRHGYASWGARSLVVSVAGLAALWHHAWWRIYPVDEVGFAAGSRPIPVCVEGIVSDAPRVLPAAPPNPLNTIREESATLLTVRVTRIRDGRAWRVASGRVAVRIDSALTESRLLASLGTGDQVELLGLLSTSARPLNPGEPDFGEYERSERRLCRLQVESDAAIRVLGRGSRWQLLGWLHWARNRCDRYLWQYVGPARAPLASAILLGTREQIDRARNDQFMVTGTVHLLSISGLHVGILAGGFWWMGRIGWVSRRVTLVGAMVFVVLYAVFTDARPPVVRSAVLISVMCLARLAGRRAWSTNSLAAAGLIVLGLNPTSFFQAGTQLSFLAVGTMSALPEWWGRPPPEDPLDRLIAGSRRRVEVWGRRLLVGVRDSLLLSTAIWWTALPLVMYRFHLVSPLATVLNPIVCLPMTAVLFTGFGVMALGGVAPPLARWCGVGCDWGLRAMEACITYTRGLPGDHWWSPSPPGWWVAIFYGAILAAWWCPRWRPSRRWCLAAALWWTALGIWLTLGPTAHRPCPRELRGTFVSVGHGTSLLLELPGGRCLLYDAGRLGTAATGARSIAAVLWSRGISHLDAVLISHADADHFNALPELLRRFSVGVVYVPPGLIDRDLPVFAALRTALDEFQVPVREITAGDVLRTDDASRLRILHPPIGGRGGSDNANSLVLAIEFAGRRMLVPGDLESPGLERLLAQPRLDCDVIMAPHHGSAHSDPAGFTDWTTPEVVVISGSGTRDSQAIEQAYAARGARVYHTAHDGAVFVRMTPEAWQVTRFRTDPRRSPR